jgi:hypothetical protein
VETGGGHQFARCFAAVPRVHPAFQKSRWRQDCGAQRRRRNESAAEYQLLRRIQGCGSAACRDLGGGIKAVSHRCERHRAWRIENAVVDQVLAAGPETVGKEFFQKNKKWAEEGAVPLELGANLAVYLAGAESNGITGKLISAQWDPWEKLQEYKDDLGGDIYTLRRIVPKDRGKKWGDK